MRTLIAIDMDGTLLGPDGQVSERNRTALRSAEAHGAEVVIATGRRHSYAMRVLRELQLPKEHALISSNGTVIRTVGSALLHRRHLQPRTARWLCAYAGEFRNTLMLTFDKVQPDGEDTHGALVCECTDELHGSIGRWMKANEAYIRQVASFDQELGRAGEEEAAESNAPIQAMLCGSVERMRAAEALLTAHPAVIGVGAEPHTGAEITLHRTAYPERDLCIVDILPAGCSKASALQELTRMRGLMMSDVLAIGDNWNDMPMLRAAGQAVLMGNAPADLKLLGEAEGWWLAPGNDEDGVAVALEAAFGNGLAALAGSPDLGKEEALAVTAGA